MKYLMIVAAALAVVWWWRRGRLRDASAARPAAPSAQAKGSPQDMLQCAVCNVHLPRPDTLFGPDGKPYCSAEHRRLRNGA